MLAVLVQLNRDLSRTQYRTILWFSLRCCTIVSTFWVFGWIQVKSSILMQTGSFSKIYSIKQEKNWIQFLCSALESFLVSVDVCYLTQYISKRYYRRKHEIPINNKKCFITRAWISINKFLLFVWSISSS